MEPSNYESDRAHKALAFRGCLAFIFCAGFACRKQRVVQPEFGRKPENKSLKKQGISTIFLAFFALL